MKTLSFASIQPKTESQDDFADFVGINWVSVKPSNVRGGAIGTDSDVIVYLKRQDKNRNYLHIRIGKAVAEKVDFKDGDRIELFTSETAPEKIVMAKSSTGYLLRDEETPVSKSKFMRLSIRATWLDNADNFKPRVVKHKIDQRRLFLRLE